MRALVELVKDPYERKARITPGLLVSLPIFVPLVSVYGAKHPIMTAVVALLGGCGAIYALASVVRGRGKQLEEQLTKSWGGMPTTIALRHRDSFLDKVSKARYHDAINSKLKIKIPTAEEEKANPEQADSIYLGATRRLRELTRSDKNLLLKENIAYGFHRNMLAMKGVGIVTSMFGLLYGAAIGKILVFDPPYIVFTNMADPGLPAGLSCLVALGLLAVWMFYFNESAVKRIGFAYAERLFEALSNIKSTAAGARKTTGS